MSMSYKEMEKELMEEENDQRQTNKYQRECKSVFIDVYDVLKAFEVTNPAIAHAVKKLLAGGQRGYKDTIQDYKEAIVSIQRAVELENE